MMKILKILLKSNLFNFRNKSEIKRDMVLD